MIKDGDIVDIFWSDGGSIKEAKIISTPGATGELWYFEDKDGDIIAQNPCSSNFDTIIKRKEK